MAESRGGPAVRLGFAASAEYAAYQAIIASGLTDEVALQSAFTAYENLEEARHL